MDTEERTAWLAERRMGIGSSDIAPVLGLSPWATPYQVWMEKTGRGSPVFSPDQVERMYWGSALESVIADRWAELHPDHWMEMGQHTISPLSPVAMATPDRVVTDHAGVQRILEIKTAHSMAENAGNWGHEDDEVPTYYYLQCQWLMGVSGVHKCTVPVLFGGQRYREIEVVWNQDVFEAALDRANQWWQDFVVSDIPPPPVSEEDARSIWDRSLPGKVVEADAAIAEAIQSLKEVKAALKELEAEERRIRDSILPCFGDAEVLHCQGKALATWKSNKSSKKTDWKSLAVKLGPPAESLIQEFSVVTPGARVLRIK